MTEQPLAIRMSSVSKAFGGVRALEDVSIEVRRGEVHALLGENGAGKSTLMKILQGVERADSGRIEAFDGPGGAARETAGGAQAGVAMIFQEFSLVPTLTVAQNVFLAREELGRGRFIDDRTALKRTRETLASMGVDIDPRARVSDLSTAQWQLVEIAKALSHDARVLVMDEPTASLARSETEALFERIAALKRRGIAIVYISHRMEEVNQVADRVTILRNGRHVLTDDIGNLTIERMIAGIVGREMEGLSSWRDRPVDREATPALELCDVVTRDLRGVSLRVAPGEIVGVAGLMGSGRTETVRAVFGIDRITSGEVRVNGRAVRLRRPQDAIAAGIALVPEDRRLQGLVLQHHIRDNLLLPMLPGLHRRGFVDDARGTRAAERLVERLDVRTTTVHRPANLLSGGNQQKVVIGKWLGTEPEILLLDEPTAGVDIGAKAEILDRVRELADDGRALLVVSSELPELLAICDRIVIMRDRRVVQDIPRTAVATEEELHRMIQTAKGAPVVNR